MTSAAVLSGSHAYHPDCWRAGGRPQGAQPDSELARWPRGKACAFCGGRAPASRPAETPERDLCFFVARLPADTTPDRVVALVTSEALRRGHSSTTASTWASAARELFARLVACGGQLPDPR